jgi:hypothetical protein
VVADKHSAKFIPIFVLMVAEIAHIIGMFSIILRMVDKLGNFKMQHMQVVGNLSTIKNLKEGHLLCFLFF